MNRSKVEKIKNRMIIIIFMGKPQEAAYLGYMG